MTTTDLVLRKQLTDEKVQLVADTIAKGATKQELALFIDQCNRTQLDPFARQIYCIQRWDSKLGRLAFQTQVSIDGARLTAQRSGAYAGQTPVYWCGEDGLWLDVWLKKEPPSAAKVGVYRNGFVEPLWAIALWSQYVQTKKDGSVTQMWAKMGSLMLGKCAEMLALRRAFPMELSGLYSGEEMSQAVPADDDEPAEGRVVGGGRADGPVVAGLVDLPATRRRPPPAASFEGGMAPDQPSAPVPDAVREGGQILRGEGAAVSSDTPVVAPNAPSPSELPIQDAVLIDPDTGEIFSGDPFEPNPPSASTPSRPGAEAQTATAAPAGPPPVSGAPITQREVNAMRKLLAHGESPITGDREQIEHVRQLALVEKLDSIKSLTRQQYEHVLLILSPDDGS